MGSPQEPTTSGCGDGRVIRKDKKIALIANLTLQAESQRSEKQMKLNHNLSERSSVWPRLPSYRVF